jgi:hypothetical protein
MSRLLLVFFIAGCVFYAKYLRQVEKQQMIREFLVQIPEGEKLLLDHFFRSLIQEDSIGYVLLGAKPMSFYSYIQPKIHLDPHLFFPIDQLTCFFEGFDENNALMQQGWEIWKKYASRFCGENILFDVMEEERELNFNKIVVINKQLMQTEMDAHFDKFTAVAPIKQGEQLIDVFLQDLSFKEKVYSRPDLLGICLGYGCNNAALFHRMSQLHKMLGHFGFTLFRLSAANIQHIESELSALEKNFKVCSLQRTSKKHLFNIGLSFRADLEDFDTLCLRKKYSKYYKILTQNYQGVNFLERTLDLIYSANESCQSLPFFR